MRAQNDAFASQAQLAAALRAAPGVLPGQRLGVG
jgi:hypothetical protein